MKMVIFVIMILGEYLMRDLHGDFQNFYKMLMKINFSLSDRFYLLGNILDKNKENLCLYSFIRDQSNMFLLKGNHEYSSDKYQPQHCLLSDEWK